MRRCKHSTVFVWLGVYLLGLFLAGCGGYSAAANIVVTVTPSTATVIVKDTTQFTATLANDAQKMGVTWSVTCTGGTCGTVSPTTTVSGVPTTYTAPANVPNPNTVTITAVSNADKNASATATVTLDSGIRVSVSPIAASVGVSETFQFTATVTNDTQKMGVTWSVTCTGTACGTVSPTTTVSGVATTYTAPASPATVTIKATAVVDTTRSGTASATVVAAADPTLTSINPTTAAQGSLFQDVYLTGTNFLSTTRVFFSGAPLDPSRITAVSPALLRVHLLDTALATATPPAGVPVTVQSKGGTPANPTPQSFRIVPVRPALVGATPDSGTQGGSSFDFIVNGGYFGTSTNPAADSVEFKGMLRTGAVQNSRQIKVTIGGAGSGDLTEAGLFPFTVRNSLVTKPAAAPQQAAFANLAVQPSSAAPGPITTAPLAAGAQPSAVAIQTASPLGVAVAVVANRGTNSISLVNLATNTVIGAPIPVGTTPTGVAVDNLCDVAVVANNGNDTLSVVNLPTSISPPPGCPPRTPAVTTITTNVGAKPFAVGVNPLTRRGLVVNQSTNQARVFDLATNTVTGTADISTGANPQVAIEPRLNWAIVTPGGGGTLSIVDLGRSTPPLPSDPPGTLPKFTVLATVTLGLGARGIGINTESERALVFDPTTGAVAIFSLLDQTVASLTLETEGSPTSVNPAAVNPLTDIGVTLNSTTGTASVIDLRNAARVATLTAVTSPRAVAIDPGSNVAVVANGGSDNLSIFSLGTIRPLHITQISPATTFTSSSPLDLTIIGKGFTAGSTVRLDDTALAPENVMFVNERRLNVTVPAALLGAPRRFAIDVESPGPGRSNVTDFTVIQSVNLVDAGGATCTAPAPRAVAIDAERNLAVVTNPGCNNVWLIDLTNGTVTANSPIAVGTNPQGVAVISRLGKAVVTNRGDNTASLVNLVAQSVNPTPVMVGTEPIGVAINQDDATTVVANSGSNNVSIFSADTGGTATSASVDMRPVAVAIDPGRKLAVVANSAQNDLTLLDLSQSSPTVTARISIALPTAVVFDPVTGFFLATSSLANTFFIVNPDTQQATPVRVGINPTSLAYNFQSSTLVTLNSASNTISVMDFLDRRVRAVLGITGSQQFSVDIHPRTNLAVIADEAKNRVLLVPLPR